MHKKNIHQTFIISHDILPSIFSNINGPISIDTIFLIVASFFTSTSTKMFEKIRKAHPRRSGKKSRKPFQNIFKSSPPLKTSIIITEIQPTLIFDISTNKFPNQKFLVFFSILIIFPSFCGERDGCANIYHRYIEVKDRTWSKISHASFIDDSKQKMGYERAKRCAVSSEEKEETIIHGRASRVSPLKNIIPSGNSSRVCKKNLYTCLKCNLTANERGKRGCVTRE